MILIRVLHIRQNGQQDTKIPSYSGTVFQLLIINSINFISVMSLISAHNSFVGSKKIIENNMSTFLNTKKAETC